jgi:hypothetical protein
MIFFCDNPPLKEKGFGLSVLTYNQLLGLGPAVKHVLTFRSTNGVSAKDILADAKWPTLLCEGPLGFLSEKRLKGKVRALVEGLGFMLSLPRIVAIARRDPGSPVFVPVGASASPLWRVRLLQALLPNPFHLYFVDDIEQINSRLVRKGEMFWARHMLPAVIRKAQRVLAISEGLGLAYRERHDVRADILLPCFQQVSAPPRADTAGAKPFTFVFSGGLSFLYNDTLLLFQEALRAFNHAHPDTPCRLLLQTYSGRKQFQELGFEDGLVEYRTSEKRGDFASYREADCFLVPYSFDPTMKIMVSTSFPQKVAELLQLGRPILFFGPSYSSVIGFFKAAGMPHVVDAAEAARLQAGIMELIRNPRDPVLQERYQEIRRKHFSSEAAASVILSNSTNRGRDA